jgi:hypothetical protein
MVTQTFISARHYLSERMVSHCHDYVGWKRGYDKVSRLTSFELFDKYGMENCRIVLIETFPCSSRDELNARESYYIRSLKYVNKVILGRTKEEYREQHKEHLNKKGMEYYRANIESIRRRKSEPTLWECGCSVSNRNLPKDEKSQKHIDTMNAMPSSSEDTIWASARYSSVAFWTQLIERQ